MELLPLEMLRKAADDRLSQKENDFLQYGFEQGDGYFRAALANFLSQRYGFGVDGEDLFVTSGISGGLSLLCTLFTRPGDTIFVEEPTYFLALRIFADHGLRIVPVRTDREGLVVENLQQALKDQRPKFLYIIPTFQNPGGHTLSRERREQLVSLAQQHDFLILADEVYQFLSYTQSPPVPFAAHLGSQHVIALSSFSKILAPGLRLGWIHTDAAMIRKMIACGVLDSGGGMNPFTSAIVRSVIESGGLEQNIGKLVEVYQRRVRSMAGGLRLHLPTAEFSAPHGGYFFWLRLPGIDTQELRKQAQAHRVGLRQGALFSSQDGLRDHLRLSISFYEENEIGEGILRLKSALQSMSAA